MAVRPRILIPVLPNICLFLSMKRKWENDDSGIRESEDPMMYSSFPL